MLPWMQSVQNKFCQWPCWLNISRCENCPPSEAKNGGFNLPKTPGSVPSAAPSAPTNTNYQRTGAQKWECYHLGDFIERNKLHQNLHLRFCDTFSRILLPANASFDVFLVICATFHPPHAVNVPIFQLPRLRQHNKTSHFGRLVTLPAQCWVSLLPGHWQVAQELEVPAWKIIGNFENTWHNGKYTFENQQQDFEQRKTYELHSEEHHHEFGKRPLAETQKMHSGRFIANLQGQMVALTFWFWLLYRVQIGRCLNLESLQTHSLTSSYRGIKKLNTCNKLW